MNINWKIRFQSKTFVIAFFSLNLLLFQQILGIFGVDISIYTDDLIKVFNTGLAIAVLIGVVHDPTTKGLSDDRLTLTKEKRL